MGRLLPLFLVLWCLFGLRSAFAVVAPSTLDLLDKPVQEFLPNHLTQSAGKRLKQIWKNPQHPTLRELIATPRSALYFAGSESLDTDTGKIPTWALDLQRWLGELGLSVSMRTSEIARLSLHPDAIHLQSLKQTSFSESTIHVLGHEGVFTVLDLLKYFSSEEKPSAFPTAETAESDLRLFRQLQSRYDSEQKTFPSAELIRRTELAEKLGHWKVDEESWHNTLSASALSSLERLQWQSLEELHMVCQSLFP